MVRTLSSSRGLGRGVGEHRIVSDPTNFELARFLATGTGRTEDPQAAVVAGLFLQRRSVLVEFNAQLVATPRREARNCDARAKECDQSLHATAASAPLVGVEHDFRLKSILARKAEAAEAADAHVVHAVERARIPLIS